MRKAIWILWPSFIVGGIAEVLFFTVIDPRELYFLGDPVEWGRMATYSVGFLLFWGLAAASSAFTCFLQRTSAEINRCPIEPEARPIGCPKREGTGVC
ncbi:MAG TPA: hypothetical protein VFC18_01435 [Burkholderiales bacterium]|nr:hypothetical protein [Burkholderiales bacterium]